MVSQYREWVLRNRCAMWKRGRSQRRLADRSSVKVDPGVLVDVKVVPSGQLHPQFVRMLAIDDWQSISSFARLEQLRITPPCHRRRIETPHCARGHRTAAEFP